MKWWVTNNTPSPHLASPNRTVLGHRGGKVEQNSFRAQGLKSTWARDRQPTDDKVALKAEKYATRWTPNTNHLETKTMKGKPRKTQDETLDTRTKLTEAIGLPPWPDTTRLWRWKKCQHGQREPAVQITSTRAASAVWPSKSHSDRYFCLCPPKKTMIQILLGKFLIHTFFG